MTITGRPRPLPECRRCSAPLPRTVWRARTVCADCATPAERMAATMTTSQLERVQQERRPVMSLPSSGACLGSMRGSL